MARCNCASPTSCGCGLTSTDSITISGSGTPGDPWLAKLKPVAASSGLEVAAGQGVRVAIDSSGGLIRTASGIATDPAGFLPRGVVAYVQRTTSQGPVTGGAQLTGFSIPFTAVAGRRYRVTASVNVLQNTAAGLQQLLINNGVGTQLQSTGINVAAGANMAHQVSYVTTTFSGATTVTANVFSSAGTWTTTTNAGAPTWFMVEDIGI